MRIALALAAFALTTPALADAKDYSLTATPPADAAVGKPALATVKLTPGAGMHVNTEFPTALTVNLPVGLEGASGKVKPAKIDRTQATFEIRFVPKKAGKAQIAATAAFVVCNDANTQCVPQHVPVTVEVTAK